MRRAVVRLSDGVILDVHEGDGDYRGPLAADVKSGLAVLALVPEEEQQWDELVWDPATKTLSVDRAKLDARKAAADSRVQASIERRARLKAFDLNNVPPAFRGLLQDLVDEVKDMGGFR